MPNDAATVAERLYSRLPEIYRSRDLAVAQQALPAADQQVVQGARPLFALVRAIASQVASVRQDMDDLWDNFFIETADDWVVPYIGALLGTNLLPNEVEQSQRLDVRNTILWRRSKGTPAMLAAVVAATSGWKCDVAELFASMMWVENLRHLRMVRPLTVSVHDRFALSRLGHFDDPFLHSPDVRIAPDPGAAPARLGLAAGRTGGAGTASTAGLGRPSIGTEGRYAVHNLGVFVRRQPTFRTAGVFPAAVIPNGPDGNPTTDPTRVSTYTFDPLRREVPLFSAATGAPIERSQFDQEPDRFFGPSVAMDVSVRRLGVPLAVPSGGSATPSRATSPFKFAGNPTLGLHQTEGLRLLEPRVFGLAGQSFIVNAVWRPTDGSPDFWLGGVSSLLTRLGRTVEAFQANAAGTALDGQLLVRIEVTDSRGEWPQLPAGRSAYFPATVLAVRDDVEVPRVATGAVDSSYLDAVLVYLPGMLITPARPAELWVATDGSTYADGDLSARANLARESKGQVWPAADLSRPSATSAPVDPGVHRVRGLAIADPGRFDPAAPVLIEACVGSTVEGSTSQEDGGIFTGTFGVGVTPPDVYPPGRWKAFEYRASSQAIADNIPTAGLRTIRLTPHVIPSFCPQFEVVLTDRAGRSLLCYLPETTFSDVVRQQEYYIHDDGSSYAKPGAAGGQQRLARAGCGQVLPTEGAYPLRRRTLCSGRLPHGGELAVDPERGLFAFPPDDPIVASLPLDARRLTVDFVESCGDQVGARAYSREVDYQTNPPTRIVSSSGDAQTRLPLSRIHTTIQDAIDNSADGEVIEIADSATYTESCSVVMSAGLKTLTVRAADQPLFARPCLVGDGMASIQVQGLPSSRLEVSGLLISGGPLQIRGELTQLLITACTLEVPAVGTVSIASGDEQEDHRARYVICRCLLGAVLTGQGIDRVVIADSVVDNLGGLAIGGLLGGSGGDPPARAVQLERATVLGRIRCDSLTGSESVIVGSAYVDDRQSGCLRFSRFDAASANHLPRRFRCLTDAPRFASYIQWRPDYARLALTTPPPVLTASEAGDAIGSFASARMGTRLANLAAKLREFLPVGLVPLVVAET